MTGLRELLAQATPRPWGHVVAPENSQLAGQRCIEGNDGWFTVCHIPADCDRSAEDFALIVGLVNAADELLDRLEKLEAVAEAARGVEAATREFVLPIGMKPAVDALDAALAALDAEEQT